MDATTSGTLLSKTLEEEYRLLEEMSANNCQWLSKRSMAKKAASILEVDPIVSLSAQVSTLANQIAAFTTGEASTSKEAAMVAITSFSGDGVGIDQEQCQFVNNRNYNYCPNNLPTYYHPSLRNHENFSYANPRNALQPPLGYSQPMAEMKPLVEELLRTFIVETRGYSTRMRSGWIVLRLTVRI